MFIFSSLALMWVQAPGAILEIPILHTRPSIIVSLMKGEAVPAFFQRSLTTYPTKRTEKSLPTASSQPGGGQALIPMSVTNISSDDERSVITVTGSSKDDLDDMARTVSLFDVAPCYVNLKIQMESRLDKTSLTSSVDLANMHTLTLADESAGAFFSIAVRVNGDWTISIYALVKEGAKQTENHKPFESKALVFRVKSNDAFQLRLDQWGRLGYFRGPKFDKVSETSPSSETRVTPVEISITPAVP
jgi:hypothetical protein